MLVTPTHTATSRCRFPHHSIVAIDDPAAILFAAQAAHSLIGFVVIIINGQFLALANVAQTHVDNMALHNARHQIGVAGVVHQFRAGAAYAAIEGPVLVQDEQIRCFGAALRLPRPDFLPRYSMTLRLAGMFSSAYTPQRWILDSAALRR